MNSAAAKARDVADDPAAERDEHGRTIDAQIEKPMKQRLDLPERLRAFTGWNGDRVPSNAEPVESRSEAGQMSIADHPIGDHDDPAAGDDGNEYLLGRLQQLLADHDVVSTSPQIHPDDPSLGRRVAPALRVCPQLGLGRSVEPVDDVQLSPPFRAL